MKSLQQHLVSDEICVKSLELFELRKSEKSWTESIYFQQYNKLVLKLGFLISSQCNTFRFHFTPNTKILAIHIYEDIYGGYEYVTYDYLLNYMQEFNMKSPETSAIPQKTNRKVFLERNLAKVKENKSRKILELQNKLPVKIAPQYSIVKMVYGTEQEDFSIAGKRLVSEEDKIMQKFNRAEPKKKEKIEPKNITNTPNLRKKHRS